MKNGIIITGGELFNKGAQSMTFNAINRLKEYYPESTIYLMSNDYYRDNEEKKRYNFNFLPPTTKSLISLNVGKKIFRDEKVNMEAKIIKDALKKSFLNIDLSGLKFSSQMGWQSSLAFLFERMLMNKYNVQQIVFPQSFGPFDFKQPWKQIINILAKKTLPGVNIIYAREDQALSNIKKYTQINVKRAYDSVFYSRPYDLKNIYSTNIKLFDFEVEKKSVGIVPNKMLLKYQSLDELVKKYVQIINEVLRYGNKVYVFRHSIEDLDICREIKKQFPNNDNVILLPEDYNSIELQKLISKLKYIIGSRYHAIVHAYVNETPALIIGWAYKYKELANKFNQTELVFDIRQEVKLDDLILAIKTLENSEDKLIEQIKISLNDIRKTDIYDQSLSTLKL